MTKSTYPMKITFAFCCLVLIGAQLSCSSSSESGDSISYEENTSTYEQSWESLAKHSAAPEWFQDAKLGIYFHWGVYTVPAFGSEWYPSNMYIEGRREYKYHLENYGSLSEFGYHHFVPAFTGEYFDANEWADLFQQAGARFAGPVAQHHDGFAMWDSEINPWNAADKGPKKDITGELAKALRQRDMKLITTFHHARNLQRYKGEEKGFGSHFTYDTAYHTSSDDPELRLLYGNIEEEQFSQYWYDQIVEVLDLYHPDIIWFDSWFNYMPEDKVKEMVAYYFNQEKKNNQEVVIAYKQNDLPTTVGVHDIEQGGRRDVSELPWMTDITISDRSWSYVEGQQYKSTAIVLRNLIDVVSKNGVVLLNLSPKADGSIPEAQRQVLTEMGNWFEANGEAIFETRPWVMYGFGDAKADQGEFGGQSATVAYTASDVRFTQSKDGKTLYMILLGEPKAGQTINYGILAKHRYSPKGEIDQISVLGSGTPVDFVHDDDYLTLTMPDSGMDSLATVFKIELK